MHNCRFCGKKVAGDAAVCEHSGKTIKKSTDESKDGVRLTSIDSWENKSIPAWVMYLVVAFFIACLGLMIYQGCNKDSPKKVIPKEVENESGSNDAELNASGSNASGSNESGSNESG
jgi:uncharacterized membrane protein YvbJ